MCDLMPDVEAVIGRLRIIRYNALKSDVYPGLREESYVMHVSCTCFSRQTLKTQTDYQTKQFHESHQIHQCCHIGIHEYFEEE